MQQLKIVSREPIDKVQGYYLQTLDGLPYKLRLLLTFRLSADTEGFLKYLTIRIRVISASARKKTGNGIL